MIMAYFEGKVAYSEPLFKLCIILRTFSKDIVWFGVKCFESEETLASVGHVNGTFCFTGASYRTQFLRGGLVLNPGFFFFLQKHFFG